MGGKISVESEEGVGTIFTFDIPYEPCFIVQVDDEKNSKKLTGKTILIAEDDHFNNLYLQEMFKEWPLDVLWAENGEEAVSLYKSNPEVSLILMDIRMPVMNGIEAANEIRSFNPAIKIIAQTAYTMANDKEKYIENGFIDYIPKPIQKEELFAMIVKWIDD